MRARPWLWCPSLGVLLALAGCSKPESEPQPPKKITVEIPPSTAIVAPPPGPSQATELGSTATPACRDAMVDFSRISVDIRDPGSSDTAALTHEAVEAAWAGPLRTWVSSTDAALGRTDLAKIEATLAELRDLDDPAARERTLLVLVTQVRTAALFELRRLLTAASDADPSVTPEAERAQLWDDAWTVWTTALRPLAARADALPKHGGEDWESTIHAAFGSGRSDLDDPVTPKAQRQVIEKGSYAVAFRLILANGETHDPAAIREARVILDMLDDRVADRNGPGLARMQAMLDGDPSEVTTATLERELAVAFTKRARKYCDKAVTKAELGSPAAIAETWEGVVYTKVILPSMRESLSDAGFDADAYAADWLTYLEAVESNDSEAAAEISARLVEWNCAYQDRLGIAECSASSNELQ